MARQIALLRGVNLGNHNKVAMPALRELFESLGLTDVITYIQSGNVVFTSAKAVKPEHLQAAIKKRFGFDVPVMLRTPTQLRNVIKNNPFPRADTSTLHVGFMANKPTASTIKAIDVDRFLPDEVAIKGAEVYFHLPNGMGRSKLPSALDRQVKVPTTIRNWNTVNKLLDLG